MAVPGLEEALREARLEVHIASALEWCERMGACDLVELADDGVFEQFADSLKLRPLESIRLHAQITKPTSAPQGPQSSSTPAPQIPDTIEGFDDNGAPVWHASWNCGKNLPWCCTERVVNAILKLASKVATKGIGEKTAAQGFLIVVGDGNRLMDPNNGLGTLPELNQYRCYNICCDALTPGSERYVVTSFVKDKAMIVDGISGKILSDGFNIASTAKGESSEGAKHQAASAIAQEGFFVVKCSEDSCSVDGHSCGELAIFSGTRECIKVPTKSCSGRSPGSSTEDEEMKRMITKHCLTNELIQLEYAALCEKDFETMDAMKACHEHLKIILQFSWRYNSTYTATRLDTQRMNDLYREAREAYGALTDKLDANKLTRRGQDMLKEFDVLQLEGGLDALHKVAVGTEPPFDLPLAVERTVFDILRDITKTISRSTTETQRLAKSIVVGDRKALKPHVGFYRDVEMNVKDPRCKAMILEAATQGKAVLVDGRTGDLYADKACLQAKKKGETNRQLYEFGTRKISALAMSEVDGGQACIVFVAAQSGEIGTYHICVRGEMWKYDIIDRNWELCYPRLRL